jgi:hypothetical protein
VENFPSNSKEPKAPRPEPVERKPDLKVVTNSGVIRRASLGSRMKEMFFGGDVKGVADYVFGDVMIPAIRDLIADSFSQAVERMIYGDSPRARRPSSRSPSSNYTNYTRYSTSKREEREPPRRRHSHDFAGAIFSTRVEAEEALTILEEVVEKYEFASVKDLYEHVNENFTHTDEKWGWSDLTDARVRRLASGSYELSLPRPEPRD